MTDYNDGKWHGWNGGECPVHPKTQVQIQTLGDGGGDATCEARSFVWNKPDYMGRPIVAFRVVKQHREPREFWLRESGCGVMVSCDPMNRTDATLFREVLE